MTIDAGIYGLLDTKGLQSGLSGIGESYARGVEHSNRLSQLAQQSQLTDLQIRAGQRAEAAMPEQKRQKDMQELSGALAFGIQQKNGYSNQDLMNSTYQEAIRRGLKDEDVAKLFEPWASVSNQTDGVVVPPTAAEQQRVADVYTQQADPKKAIDLRLAAMNPKHLVGDTPEIIRLQNFAESLPEGPNKDKINARIDLLGSRTDRKEQFQEVGAPGKSGDWRIKARMGDDGKPEYFGQPYQIGSGVTAANKVVPATEYEKTIQKALGKENSNIVEAGKGAANAIENAQMIRDTIERGAITGTGAGARLMLEKALATAGLTGEGKAADTQALMSGLSKITLAGIKTSGLGTGQGFTEKDLLFLNDSISGSIDSTPQNMLRVADLSEKVARENHAHASRLTNRWKEDPKMKAYAQDIILPPIQEAKKPARRASDSSPKVGAKFLGFE